MAVQTAFIRPLLLLIVLVYLNCSASKQSIYSHTFQIEYYTIGGFAGTSEGITVTSDGWEKFWHGRTIGERVVTDSVRLSSERMSSLSSLLDSEELFNIKMSSNDNLSTVITIRRGDKMNKIKYSATQLPESAPATLKNLLNTLQQIHKPTE